MLCLLLAEWVALVRKKVSQASGLCPGIAGERAGVAACCAAAVWACWTGEPTALRCATGSTCCAISSTCAPAPTAPTARYTARAARAFTPWRNIPCHITQSRKSTITARLEIPGSFPEKFRSLPGPDRAERSGPGNRPGPEILNVPGENHGNSP